jgi:Predicted membrane protein (DUF2207) C-terminal domain/Predicted membrane protein (DUF2207) N-terminal domain
VGWVALAGGSLLAGAAAAAGVLASDTERMVNYWTRAEVASSDGSAAVVEVIDWDFGNQFGKHGIFRFIPDLPETTHVDVESPDAPDQKEVSTEIRNGRSYLFIKIGDPATTVSGTRRYRIDYSLPGVVRGTDLDWEAVGDQWPVDIENAEVHLLTPFEVTDPRCLIGTRVDPRECDVQQVEPGHLLVQVDKVPKGQGVSLEGTVGDPLTTLPAVPQPPGPPDDPGTGFLPPAGTAAAASLLAGIPAAVLVRRAGRERIAPGGEADVAYAEGPPHVSEIRVDAAELARMATTEFAPPSGVSPAQGGIVLKEDVRPEHKVAWLIQAAIDGAIDVQDSDSTTTITRTGPGSPEEEDVLGMAFGGRSEVELGSYDPAFASAWSHLGGTLSGWRDRSGLWDSGSQTRRVLAIVLGGLVAVLGAVAAAGGGALAGRFGPEYLPVAALGGVLFGAGLAAVLGAWELPVRTAAGSGLFLRVESFRRFLAESEAYHAEEAAKRGVLREYTAWAVALDEIDRWERAVSSSTVIPETAGLHYIHMAPLLLASTITASTAPRSSGGGGGFGGGSIGGGAGGGGGGSW